MSTINGDGFIQADGVGLFSLSAVSLNLRAGPLPVQAANVAMSNADSKISFFIIIGYFRAKIEYICKQSKCLFVFYSYVCAAKKVKHVIIL